MLSRFKPRPTVPPAPPAPFDPGRIPQDFRQAAMQQQELEADHARMKPDAPRTTLGPMVAFIPPVTLGIPHRDKTKDDLKVLEALTKRLAPFRNPGEALNAVLDRIIAERNEFAAKAKEKKYGRKAEAS